MFSQAVKFKPLRVTARPDAYIDNPRTIDTHTSSQKLNLIHANQVQTA